MSEEIKINVGKLKDGRYFLEINKERVLVDLNLSSIVDRIESELKRKYGIADKKGWGFFK